MSFILFCRVLSRLPAKRTSHQHNDQPRRSLLEAAATDERCVGERVTRSKDRGKVENKNKLEKMNNASEKKTFSLQPHSLLQTNLKILCGSECSEGWPCVSLKRIEFLFFP